MDRLDMSLDDLAKAKKNSDRPKPKVVKSAPKAGKQREQPKQQQQQQQQQYQQPRGGGGSGGILSRVGVSSEASGTLVVFRNLKYEVTDRDIRELALTIGEIKRGNLVLGPGGRSSGAAEVVYVSRSDAIKAVKKFNGLTLDNRPMDVMLGEGSVAAPGKSSVFGSALGGGGNPRFSVTLSDPALSGGRGGGGGGGGRNVIVKQQQQQQQSNKKPNNNSRNNGGGNKGGRDAQKQRSGGGDRDKPVSAEDLDKQLEKFLASKKTDA
jgi:THO complex subunit 4